MNNFGRTNLVILYIYKPERVAHTLRPFLKIQRGAQLRRPPFAISRFMESQKRETENEPGNAKTLESEAVTRPPTAERPETPLARSLPPAASEEGEAEPTSAQTTTTSGPLAAVPATDLEKKLRRAERFGMAVQLSEEEKRSARAHRFDFLKSLLNHFLSLSSLCTLDGCVF